MSDLKIIIGNKRYSTWSLRGWLAVQHIGLPFSEVQLSLDTPEFYEEFALRTTEFMGAVKNADALAVCVAISKDVMASEYYQALAKCRSLIEFEKERLEYVPGGVSESPENDRESA